MAVTQPRLQDEITTQTTRHTGTQTDAQTDKHTHKPTNRRTTRQTCSKRGWGPPLTDYTCTYVANTVKLTLSLRPDLQRFLPA